MSRQINTFLPNTVKEATDFCYFAGINLKTSPCKVSFKT